MKALAQTGSRVVAVDIDEKALRCGSLPFAEQSRACAAHTLGMAPLSRFVNRRLVKIQSMIFLVTRGVVYRQGGLAISARQRGS